MAYADKLQGPWQMYKSGRGVLRLRDTLDYASDTMRAAVADEPFSNDLANAKWRYYFHLAGLPEGNSRLSQHAHALAQSGVALIPTFSLLYLDMPWSKNP